MNSILKKLTRKYGAKASTYWHETDNILDPISFANLIMTTFHNSPQRDEKAVRLAFQADPRLAHGRREAFDRQAHARHPEQAHRRSQGVTHRCQLRRA